ncbi:MAG: hypothetical protein JW850_12950, partial [Thermoflexales bacterium]|nr:hypothetical protein [Thermoflexales bacterium]
ILLPEYDHEEEAQAFIETIYPELFEVELDSWYRDPSWWPADQSYQAFLAWFEIELYSMVLDPQKGRIIRRRYPAG